MGKTLYGYANKLWSIVHEFEYTGEPQPFTLTPGEYLLICHGGMGCTTPSETVPYSFGGAAYGIININKSQKLYAYVGGNGGMGTNTNPGKGGWNGGADGGFSYSSSYLCGNGGGGASDIRLYTESDFDEDGENKSLLSRIIVAGGAGGRGFFNVADWMFAFGGGINGGYYGGVGGSLGNDPYNKKYASQTEGYSFGKGKAPSRPTSTNTNGSEGSGGGGGGWFGGYSTSVNGQYCSMSGGGGSGYVLTEESYKPEGYIPTSEFYLKDTCLQPCQSTNPTVIVLKEIGEGMVGDKIVIPFTGKPTKLNLYDGEYRFKCWGGEGGRRFSSNYKRAYGGYSEGKIKLQKPQSIWCYVGGSGLLANRTSSDIKLFNPDMGYNGGGNPVYGSETLYTGSGGGATDFRLYSMTDPIVEQRYLKLQIRKTRTETSDYIQFSEIEFYDENDQSITIKNVYASTSDTEIIEPTSAENEKCGNLIDGDSSTKMVCSWSKGSILNLYFTLDHAHIIKSFKYMTADNDSARDPVSWTLYSSDSLSDPLWRLIMSLNDQTIPSERNTWTNVFSTKVISSSEEQSLLSRIIVAGGGGSEGKPGGSFGGSGGGLTGGKVSATTYGKHGGPGTQTSSPESGECTGGFGYGGNAMIKDNGVGGAGGGGWFGGSGTVPDTSGDNDSAGAGGSGYILTESSYKPIGYIPDKSYNFSEEVTTTGGNTLMPNMTKAEIDIIRYNFPFVVHDAEGYKIFNKELDSWEYYNDEMSKEEIAEYGCKQFVNFNGVLDEFDIVVYDKYDIINTIEVDHTANQESVTKLVPINFPIVNKFIDYEYDPEKYDLQVKIKPYNSEYMALTIYIDKLIITDEKLKLYAIQLYSK